MLLIVVSVQAASIALDGWDAPHLIAAMLPQVQPPPQSVPRYLPGLPGTSRDAAAAAGTALAHGSAQSAVSAATQAAALAYASAVSMPAQVPHAQAIAERLQDPDERVIGPAPLGEHVRPMPKLSVI